MTDIGKRSTKISANEEEGYSTKMWDSLSEPYNFFYGNTFLSALITSLVRYSTSLLLSSCIARRQLTHRKRIAYVQVSTIDLTLFEAKSMSSLVVIFSGRSFGIAEMGREGKTSVQHVCLSSFIKIKIIENKNPPSLADEKSSAKNLHERSCRQCER